MSTNMTELELCAALHELAALVKGLRRRRRVPISKPRCASRPAKRRSAPLLPSPGYLRLCAEAHKRAGLLDHFLDCTVLIDGVTTLRDHCARSEEAGRIIASLPAAEAGC